MNNHDFKAKRTNLALYDTEAGQLSGVGVDAVRAIEKGEVTQQPITDKLLLFYEEAHRTQIAFIAKQPKTKPETNIIRLEEVDLISNTAHKHLRKFIKHGFIKCEKSGIPQNPILTVKTKELIRLTLQRESVVSMFLDAIKKVMDLPH